MPEQFVSSIAVGQPITFEVDAYPGRQFNGKVRYVSPALKADQRALTVEAMVPNPRRRAEAGPVCDRAHRAAEPDAGRAGSGGERHTSAGTSRVYVVTGDHVEERIVTTGQTVGDLRRDHQGLESRRARRDDESSRKLADGIKV